MLNFDYSIPTKIFFGRDRLSVLAKQVMRYGSRVLLVYGGGSIKRTGLYDKVTGIFKENGISFWELGGVQPNPRITKVNEGIAICREHGIELVLAVGGGSTIDTAKVIGAGCAYDGDAWDIVLDRKKIKNVIPIASIPTIAATGSEMDAIAVISNLETKQKCATAHGGMFPKFSILDPTYTFSVPRNQTAAGTADIMSHIFESYFSSTKEAFLQDRMAEALMKTCIQYGRKAMDEPENYEARANLMWTSSLAINGLLGYGKESVWSVHTMEHELSAYYDITHGVGLAILTPYWMEYGLNDDTLYKFVEFGINVWGLDSGQDAYAIARGAIEKTKEFFKSLEMPSTLHEVGIGEEYLKEMAKNVTLKKNIGGLIPLDTQDVLNIYKAAL
ncbi:MAG: iron-containing alcohol dehydrogenase [Bacillota bacterium]